MPLRQREKDRFAVVPFLLLVLTSVIVLGACDGPFAQPTPTPIPTNTPLPPPTETPVPPTATTVPTVTPSPIPASERKWIPIFSYHHIRDWEGSDSEDDRAYIVEPKDLETQL